MYIFETGTDEFVGDEMVRHKRVTSRSRLSSFEASASFTHVFIEFRLHLCAKIDAIVRFYRTLYPTYNFTPAKLGLSFEGKIVEEEHVVRGRPINAP